MVPPPRGLLRSPFLRSPTARGSLALVLGLAVGFLVYRRRAHPSASPPFWPDAFELHVPHVQGSIVLDNDSDDSGWRGPTARTHAFVGADGVTPAHPHTEVRLVWGDGFLYLNLYSADEDIHALSVAHDAILPGDDVFHLAFTDRSGSRVFDINPLGVMADGFQASGAASPDLSWESLAHLSHELDGTPNKSTDHDEEWVIELAIPFESLGLRGRPGDRIGLAMERCDTPLDGKRVCGSWGKARHAVLVLE